MCVYIYINNEIRDADSKKGRRKERRKRSIDNLNSNYIVSLSAR